MSTRGAIGMRQPDGSVRAVYVHHDAYVAGVGAILGGSGNRLKPLREGKRTFDLITMWMPPGEVPPPRMTVLSLGGGNVQ